MDYRAATEYLVSLIDYERTPAAAAAVRLWNLDRIRHMLQEKGNPHAGLRFLHIAGTRGKGSTAAMAAGILTAAGYRTGLYTSPHLVSFRERIRIDGRLIPEAAVAALVEEVKPIVETMRESELGPPSFFDTYTFIALLYFAREKVDFAVLEPGLGGRLDSTNVVTPLVCAITRIGLDHTQELGDTITQIAGEKAGIIKPGVPVVSAPQVEEARGVIEQVCRERGSPLLVVGSEAGPQASVVKADWCGQLMKVRRLDGAELEVECPLTGAHQAENAAVAVGLIDELARQGIAISNEALREGMRSVYWPGRLQVVRREPFVVLDGAHDETGAEALVEAMKTLFPGRRMVLVFGMMRGHDPEAVAGRIIPMAAEVIVTASASPRALEAAALARIAGNYSGKVTTCTPVAQALRQALEVADKEAVVLVTGSLYVVGEAMTALGVSPEKSPR